MGSSMRYKNLSWRDGNNWHHFIELHEVMMVHHLSKDHGLTVRQIGSRLGLSDLEVKYVLAKG